jgi:hypothetical protein
MSAIILNMEQYRKPNMFFIKMDCLYFKTNKFQYWNWFWYRIECFYERNKMNQSIDYVGVEAYPVSAEELVSWITSKNWMLWITRVFLIKCIKVIGEKRESRRWFSLTKGSNCLKRLMIWTGSIWFILMLSVIVCNRNYGVLQYSKNVWCTQKQWRTSYLCCSWCS